MNRKKIIQANESFWNVFSKKKLWWFLSPPLFWQKQSTGHISAWLTVQDQTCRFCALQTWAISITWGWTCERLMFWCKAKKPQATQTSKASKTIYIFCRSPQNIFNQMLSQLCSTLCSILPFEDFKTKVLTFPSKKSFKTFKSCVWTLFHGAKIFTILEFAVTFLFSKFYEGTK